MGKKKGGAQHAQNSFAQLVGKANQEALKPYILQVIGEVGNDISRRVMSKMAILQNRIEALETILKERLDLTQVELDNSLFDLEDRVTGYIKVDRPAQEGDLLRLTMRTRKVDSEEFGKPQKREFSNLGKPPYALGVEFVEKALIGAEIGKPVVVPFDKELQEATKTQELEFTIDRVSELIAKPEPKKEEPKNATEGETTPEPTGSGESEQAG